VTYLTTHAPPAGSLAELRTLAHQVSAEPERAGVVPGLRIYAEPHPTSSIPVVFDPVLYVVLQGTKQLLLDDRVIRYDQSQLVIVTVNLPALAQVMCATPEEPYLAVEVQFDRGMLAELINEVGPSGAVTSDAVSVHDTPVEIYEPLQRLLRMTSDPRAAALFAASAVREIVYHVLASPQGGALRQMANFHSPLARVAQVTTLMAQHLADPLSVPQLAHRVGMSVTSMHRHFRSSTGTTPSTYYKRLRLHEARRLAVVQMLNVTEASGSVGYASVAHFSRDYKQLFGEPPLRNFARLRKPDST
jgi:AraC-like DNA-binding protein